MPQSTMFDQTSGLFMDLYALTMARVEWEAGELDRTGTSEVYFRQPLSNGIAGAAGEDGHVPYFVVSGIASFFKWFNNWTITDDDAAYLATLKTPKGNPLFPDAFISVVQKPAWNLSFTFIPEGELAFPGEPVGFVAGPQWQTQLIEAALLNRITAETIWATIGSQYQLAATTATKRAKIYEFGARRACEWGDLGPARSAYLAGWDGTSNLLAARVYGIPPSGTIAHSFIMSRLSDKHAFGTWSDILPDFTMGLPDTYSTPMGVDDFISVCKEKDVAPLGCRLDSGDADYLSRMLRDKFDKSGFTNAIAMYSNSASVADVFDLIQVKHAPIDAFGVGTHFVKQTQDPKLSAVMKLVHIRDKDGDRDVMKFADDGTGQAKISKAGVPGVQRIARILAPAGADGIAHYAGDILLPTGKDAIGLGAETLGREIISVSLANPNALKVFPAYAAHVDPMVVFMKDGKHCFADFEGLQDEKKILADSRARYFASMARLDSDHKQLVHAHPYGVGLEEGLDERRRRMMRDVGARVDRVRQAARFTA